jgi:hypothetical protein
MAKVLFGLAIFSSSNNKKENKKIVELVMLEYILCIHTNNKFLLLILEIK